MKKTFIIIDTFLLLVIIGTLCYFKFRFKLEVTLKDNLSIGFGEKVNLKDFIVTSNAEFLDKEVEYYEIGEEKVTLEYIDKYKKKKEFTFNINVIDKTNPIILASDTKYAYVSEETNLLKNVICADYESSEVTCEVKGEYDLTKLGTYNLTYVARDESLNETTKSFKLNVIKRPTGGSSSNIIGVEYTPFTELYEAYKKDNTRIGIDVSRFQGDIDFEKVRDDGCEFVIIRLGWDVDGELGLDYNYEKYIDAASKAGLDIGLYFYSEAKSMEDIYKETEFIKNNIKHEIKLPIAYDWEDFNDYNSYKVSLYEFNKMAKTFISELEKSGYSSILYGSKYYLTNIWNFKDVPVWLAQYYDEVTYDGKYKMWQITDSGSISGIKRGVDVDILYLD